MKTTIKKQTAQRSLHIIADEILEDWGSSNVNYAAKPYLNAMLELGSIDDEYYLDNAKSIVLYFLANAGSWRGEVAKRVKLELKQMCK